MRRRCDANMKGTNHGHARQPRLAVTQQQAWDALNDPEVLKVCIPGCDKVESTGDNQYAVAMAVKVGPVSAKFTGKITLTECKPPESYTWLSTGRAARPASARAREVRLTPQGTGCELAYTVRRRWAARSRRWASA